MFFNLTKLINKQYKCNKYEIGIKTFLQYIENFNINYLIIDLTFIQNYYIKTNEIINFHYHRCLKTLDYATF